MRGHFGAILLGLVIFLWLLSLVLLLGPMYQPQCNWYAYDQSYQESLASLGCLFSSSLSDATVWLGDRTTPISAAITAIATGVIGWFTVTLASVGRSQVKDTRILQRAYISVEPGGIRPFEAMMDDRLACDVVITNAGNLPARGVAWFIDRKFSADPQEKDFPIPETGLSGDIVLVPKGTARKGSNPASQKELLRYRKEAKPDRAWWYVWGRVIYHDGFRSGRSTNFCHRYNLHGISGGTITADKARYHEYGNRTDEE